MAVTIPTNEKVKPKVIPDQIKVLVYGAPFMGKTTLLDSFPDTLILSTDGNTLNCTSPSILICDQIEKNGRMTKTTLAWDYFKEVLDELEKHEQGYKTIGVDLVDDLYDMCRIAKCKELGIKHESDNPGKAWDMVRSEFRNQMRRLSNMGYHIVWNSHEDVKMEFMGKDGDNVKAINPSLQPKIANKLSGMVTICMRAVKEKGQYKLKLEEDGIMFTGSRLSGLPSEIPTSYEAIENLYTKIRSEQ